MPSAPRCRGAATTPASASASETASETTLVVAGTGHTTPSCPPTPSRPRSKAILRRPRPHRSRPWRPPLRPCEEAPLRSTPPALRRTPAPRHLPRQRGTSPLTRHPPRRPRRSRTPTRKRHAPVRPTPERDTHAGPAPTPGTPARADTHAGAAPPVRPRRGGTPTLKRHAPARPTPGHPRSSGTHPRDPHRSGTPTQEWTPTADAGGDPANPDPDPDSGRRARPPSGGLAQHVVEDLLNDRLLRRRSERPHPPTCHAPPEVVKKWLMSSVYRALGVLRRLHVPGALVVSPALRARVEPLRGEPLPLSRTAGCRARPQHDLYPLSASRVAFVDAHPGLRLREADAAGHASPGAGRAERERPSVERHRVRVVCRRRTPGRPACGPAPTARWACSAGPRSAGPGSAKRRWAAPPGCRIPVLSSSAVTPTAPHTHSSRTSGITTSAIAAGRPRYFCGAGPIAPSSRAIAGARYSTSTTWPGWTGTTVSAVPIRDGSRYGTCTWTWC